jgi:hypothetical protein
MMTASMLRSDLRTRGWWNNLLRREVMLRIFLSPVRSGPGDCHFRTASPPHAYPFHFLNACIIFTSIVSLLMEGVTPRLFDPSTHFQTVLLRNASERRHVLQQYIPDPSTMFHSLLLYSIIFCDIPLLTEGPSIQFYTVPYVSGLFHGW